MIGCQLRNDSHVATVHTNPMLAYTAVTASCTVLALHEALLTDTLVIMLIVYVV
jgi:hypothetical protein